MSDPLKSSKLLFLLCVYVIVITKTAAQQTSNSKSCLDDPIKRNKYPNYMSTPTDIVIATTDSDLHQISTEIFRIYLTEVMGFQRIRIIPQNDSYNVTHIAATLSPPPEDEHVILPQAMLNLQVWLPWDPEFDITDLEDTTAIKELGNLIPAGRFGWFIPKTLAFPVKQFYGAKWERNISEVHWSLLKDRDLVAYFEPDAEGWSLVNSTLNFLVANKNSSACLNRTVCKGGIHTPSQCRQGPCALLLTSDYHSMQFVLEHINQAKLYVKVAFLGAELREVVRRLQAIYELKNSRKSMMILHYTPGEVILRERNFISVTFPTCDILSLDSVGCKYGLQRIVKLAWSKVENLGLLPSIRNFRFNEAEYDQVLTLYEQMSGRENGSMRNIACKWMRQNLDVWERWKIESDDILYIGGIFPITESSYNGAGIVAGTRLATHMINSDPKLLANYKLEISVADGKCRADRVMKAFIDYTVDGYYNKLIGVLGPACSDTVEPLAGVSKHYKIMVISYSAEGASFSDREKYPYFFRTIGENKDYKHVYTRFFKRFKWTRIAALTEDGQKYTEYISHMQGMLEENGIQFIANIKFPREREPTLMTRYLEDLKRKRARIIILDVYDDVARTVMCQAYHMKMTSTQGYVWFLPNWLNSTWFDTDFYNQFTRTKINCTTDQMKEAVKGYFSMAHAYYAPDNTTIKGNLTVAAWKELYKDRFSVKGKRSHYAGFAYDAVWTYALALDELMKENAEYMADLHSENTTERFHQLIRKTDFMGVSGQIKFRDGPSRVSVINVQQYYETSENDTISHIVAQFTPEVYDNSSEIKGGVLWMNDSALKWFTEDGKMPDDGTPPPTLCTLDSLAKLFNVDCEMAIVILNLLVGSILLLTVSFVIYFIKKQYDKKVQNTQKYMRHLGIDMLLNPQSLSDLDKWEVPRSSVVINRKLGEGAFGMVYGGEAEFPGKDGWVAVAVKTLRVGSTSEEKLDFLSEAEVMKRFDHKNIVKLLGVSTKEEPVYTIMEFMLYGDLKTFLLARRHLVNHKSIEESDEVSSKKLTGMALDVARGLSYLASMKYVHRDVASRNCLVNAQRVVKLGDFGMTRPMMENDYYRFTRKGMLPVRWMSPESLALGVFTAASDVWSFGVLLYEIITFGSFPYQAMSNQEVLEYVKTGRTIQIPEGIKPQLKCLLKSCWQPDPKDRIRASEIVEFLANNPRLLAPCLDVPISSVQLDDTGDEINLPDQFRKCSTSDMKPSPSIPNGIAGGHSFDQQMAKSKSEAGAGGVNIQLENCCPKEPLLGRAKSSSSLLNFGKYVSLQHGENREEDEDEYMSHNPANNGFVISKV